MAVTDYLLNTKDDPAMYAIVAYYFANMFDSNSEFAASNVEFIVEELELDEHQREIFFREAKNIFYEHQADAESKGIE